MTISLHEPRKTQSDIHLAAYYYVVTRSLLPTISISVHAAGLTALDKGFGEPLPNINPYKNLPMVKATNEEPIPSQSIVEQLNLARDFKNLTFLARAFLAI